MRLIFWFTFKNPVDPIPTNDLLYAFYLGTKFDLRLTLYVLIPVFLIGWISWFSPFRNKYTHHFWLAYLVIAASGVLLFYLVDFGHYAYLNKRVDATVLRFLDNFTTSSQMVWESYHVIPWSLLVIFLVSLDAYVVHRLLKYYAAQPTIQIRKRHKLWIAPVSFFVFLFAIFGKFSYYPLRWSDAFFSTNAYASSVASNPVLYFFNTIKNKQITFDTEKTRHYYDLMVHYLGVDHPDKAKLNYTRHVPAKQQTTKPPNVVMVFLESFAAYKTGAFGNGLDPTPYFDKLESNSISFRHYFAPHTGTARSVFAAITGLPDIETHKTSTRNPLVVDQRTIINNFKGYEKFYFIGGSANWGNIRGILQNNITGLHLYEEGSYTKPRMDVWGIDDASLFVEANWVLRKQDKPFFAIIQTAGNHRPYHIPEDSYGFKRRHVDKELLRKNGFISEDEFNAFRFLDYSVGYFIKQARKEPYFDNTIFVFYGDHGIVGYPGEHSPAYLNHTQLTGMQTPLIFYAPKLLKPEQIQKVASELDLLPTIAGLTGTEYTNTTLGRDLLDPTFDKDRYAFIFTHGSDYMLGLLSKDYYLTVLEDGSKTVLYDIHAKDDRNNVVAEHPEQTEKMRNLALGIFETTKYMLHHNKPDKQ
ncbi:MAG: sulfatase-like hydrolase/transferase [Thioalkalispiraceae bacterium]